MDTFKEVFTGRNFTDTCVVPFTPTATVITPLQAKPVTNNNIIGPFNKPSPLVLLRDVKDISAKTRYDLTLEEKHILFRTYFANYTYVDKKYNTYKIIETRDTSITYIMNEHIGANKHTQHTIGYLNWLELMDYQAGYKKVQDEKDMIGS